jgi:hypothetical protein
MRFVVEVRGRNFLVSIDGTPDPRPYGFLTQVEVDALDEAGAEAAAIGLLRNTQTLLDRVRNTRHNPPRMFVERMGEYDAGPLPPLTIEPTLIWFPENESEGDSIV